MAENEKRHLFAHRVDPMSGNHLARCTCGWTGTWWPKLNQARESWKRHLEPQPTDEASR